MVGCGWIAESAPIEFGSPATLFTTMVTTAPAFWALRTLSENEHPPRETTAILPVRLAAGSAVQARPRPLVEPVTTPSGAVRSLDTTGKSPTAALYVVAPTCIGA